MQQSLAQKLRKAKKQCEPCEGIEQQAEQCLVQVCKKAQQKCPKQKKQQCQKDQTACEPACKRKVQCDNYQKGKQIRVSQKQVQFGCKTNIDLYNQCLEKKHSCDPVQITRKHRQKTQRVPSGGFL